MSREEIKRNILELLNKCNNNYASVAKIVKKRFENLYHAILSETSFLVDNPKWKMEKDGSRVPMMARIYAILNDISEQPTCRICGKPSFFNFTQKKFSNWCSVSCSQKDPETRKKLAETCKKLHGSENYRNSKASAATRRRKYDGRFTSKDFAEKSRKTKEERYGNPTFNNRDKSRKTKLERYGDENYNNSPKARETKQIVYGDENYNNRAKFKTTMESFDDARRKESKERRRATCIERFGVDSPLKSAKILEKARNTCNSRYGVDSPLSLAVTRRRLAKTIREGAYENLVSFASSSGLEFLSTKEEFESAERLSDVEFKWRCGKCGTEFLARYDNGICTKLCPKCGTTDSRAEQSRFYEALRSIYDGPISTNCRGVIPPREVDFYLPEKRLAIEFDGLYWHSELRKDRGYHLEKTEACLKNGVRLIHVFEDEWRFRRKTVVSRLRSILGRNRRAFARKCKIRDIDNQTKRNFLEKYHIQGDDKSGIRYGLFYNDHLVAVMTFAKARFGREYEWELSRYATVANFRVVGGAGKLLAHFERTIRPSSLVTYADRRWSVGNLYERLGFKHIRNSAPSYFYVKGLVRHNRMNFQKHMLSKVFPDFDPTKTEHQNMAEHGYLRIYDCGNMVFAKKYA